MRPRAYFAASLLLAAVFVPRAATPRAAASRHVQAHNTTLSDQVDLRLTVYNSGLALIRDVREVGLPVGQSDLNFVDIASTVVPATVHVRSLTEPSRLGVREQNYEYDLLEPEKLLRKYVGRDVTLVRNRLEGGATREEEIKARLLSYNNGPVWKIGEEIVTGLPSDHIRFPELPDNLYTRPTLVWLLVNRGAARHRLETSYLANQLAWNADYVLTIDRADKGADLDGWVTLTNNTGTSFRNAGLQLVAGNLNRVRQEMNEAVAESAAKRTLMTLPMAQEAFSEYHLYTLAAKTTIQNAETKQVSMLSATNVPVEKRYVVDGQAYYYRMGAHPGAPLKSDVQVFYALRNEEKGGLGMPIPAGVVRVYQADSRGGVQFVGEDRIDHTPKDEAVNLKIGSAFDVVCDRLQTDFQKVGGSVYESAYKITLRNHKTTAVTVEVNEPIGATWQMVQSSQPFTKTSAFAAQFKVPVPADGSVVLTYRVRVTF